MEPLRHFVEEAHEDARRHLRSFSEISLDPLREASERDWADDYPALLHLGTLKGYLGEVLAGIICEYFAPLGEDNWRVPAYLFRFHNVAIQQMIRIQQTDQEATPIPGRTGNDCLAFLRNEQGQITCILFCEAKCTADHRSGMIRDAHEQLSDETLVPVSMPQVIEVLRARGGPEAERWAEALLEGYLGSSECERFDLVAYVCGQPPVMRSSWIPADEPHSGYSGGRPLEAVEIHVDDVESLIEEVYGYVPAE
jgi:hypothetical protein